MKGRFLVVLLGIALLPVGAFAVPAEKPCSYHYYCNVSSNDALAVRNHLLTISNGECVDPQASCNGKIASKTVAELADPICATGARSVSFEGVECSTRP